MAANNMNFPTDSNFKSLVATSRFVGCHAFLEWRIENFSLSSTTSQEKLRSPQFSSSLTTWMLELCPNGKTIENVGKVGFCLTKISPDSRRTAKYKVWIKDRNNANHFVIEGEKVFTNSNDNRSTGSLPTVCRELVNRPLLTERRQDLLFNDVLTVCCEVIDIGKVIHGADEMSKDENLSSRNPAIRLESLSKDLGDMFESQLHTDVVLNVEGRKFKAHKVVLCARSVVFAAMFSHDMKEKLNNVIEIAGIQPEIMADVLFYIYTGKIKELSFSNVQELCIAADRYSLKDLTHECLNFMLSNLTVQNFGELVNFCTNYDDSDLRHKALRFFRENANEIVSTNQWKIFRDEKQRIAIDLLEKNTVRFYDGNEEESDDDEP